MENIVVISGCMHPDAEKTASWLEKNGNKVYRTDFDLLDEEKMAAFIKEIEEKEGKIRFFSSCGMRKLPRTAPSRKRMILMKFLRFWIIILTVRFH